jgi:uncharacterized protein (TIGR02118 family)
LVKVIFGWRDHPGKNAEECEQHYRSVHMKLARAAFDGVDGFVAIAYDRVRAHAVNDYNQPQRIVRSPDLDAFCELYFRDQESMAEAFKRPQMQKLFDDHVNFMDTESASNIRIYTVEESVFFGRRPELDGQ